eukprot:7806987-Ditylum_brightwellii.AAC.1
MEADLIFPQVQPTNNEGIVFKQRRDPNKCLRACNGNWLGSPFQCEFCLVQNLLNRDTDKVSLNDQQLLMYARRVNLDIFWARAASTINRSVTGLQKGLRLATDLGIPPPCPPQGP